MLGSAISSASIWTPWNSVATAAVRTLKARFYVAWTRVVSNASFAVVGTSLVGGLNVVQGTGVNVVSDANLYDYFDETVNVISLEYERSLLEPLGGIASAIANILLDNTDLRFTPNYNATIGTAIKPNRPLRMSLGFQVLGQEVLIPIISGLSQQPQEDKTNRTLAIQAFDFMQYLNQQPLESAIYTNQRSDQIIAAILASAGVGSNSYILDTGLNTIQFAWFQIGQTAGERIRQICEAEQAIFFADETGVLHFENRDKYSESPYDAVVWTIDPDDILQWTQNPNSQIINYALISGKSRSVKGTAEIWRDGIEEVIAAGATLEITASFKDPAATIEALTAINDYQAFSGSGGTGDDVTTSIAITLTSYTTSAVLTIKNNSTSTVYLNFLRLRGALATVDYEISEIYQDNDSITNYTQQQVQITNDFITDSDFAKQMAQDLVNRWKDPMKILEIKVQGLPQLQLRDRVKVKDPDLGTYTDYRVIGIKGQFDPGSFIQTLTLREITAAENL